MLYFTMIDMISPVRDQHTDIFKYVIWLHYELMMQSQLNKHNRTVFIIRGVDCKLYRCQDILMRCELLVLMLWLNDRSHRCVFRLNIANVILQVWLSMPLFVGTLVHVAMTSYIPQIIYHPSRKLRYIASVIRIISAWMKAIFFGFSTSSGRADNHA